MYPKLILCQILVATFLGGSVLGAPGTMIESGASRRKAREERRFILGEGQTKIELERSFIIPGSDSLTIDGRPVERGTDYRFNALKGTIVLVDPAGGGELLVIRFSRYPLPFSPVFASRVPAGVSKLSITAPGRLERGERPAGPKPFNLRLSGSKTVGATAGTGRGLGLEQSLKISISGKIAEDLEISAFLTDDDLRVQPEGNTEELRHLEKVYVKIKSRHSEVQLGDFATGNDWSSFARFERELRGGTATVHLGGRSLLFGGGLAKGRFKTVSFFGRDGVQGPYELLSARRFNGVVILPGSETVYFNGTVLKRGAENGYTIDYNRGTVTFTERMPVTDYSEIVIDFQIGEDSYERTSLIGGLAVPLLEGRLRVRTLFFQESDDPEESLTGELREEDREALEAAGDDPARAFTSGIREVEAGEGNYLLVPADSIPEHFEYAESGGNYRLDFYEIGTGRGDYKPDGFTARGEVKYIFVGEGEGDYVVGRGLALPERTRLFSLGLSGERGRFFAEAEGNLSLHDKNLLSPLDDGDNAGSAFAFEGGLKKAPLPYSDLTLKGFFSSLESRFKPPDKTRESYFYRNWNLEDRALDGTERLGGLSVALEGESSWRLEGSHELLSRDGLDARKSELETFIGNHAERGLRIRALESKVGEDRDRRIAAAEGSFRVWRLVPTVAYETERYRSFVTAAPDTGRLYHQGTISLRSLAKGRLSGNLSFGRRLTDRLSTDGRSWIDDRRNDEIHLTGGYSGAGRVVDLLVTHRETLDEGSGVSSTHDLARLRYREAWDAAGLANDVSYRITSGEERRREKTVIYVGENQGDYDSEGREVGQKRGDYMILYLPGEESESLRTVEMTWRLSIGTGVRGVKSGQDEDGWFGAIRRNVSCDNFLSVVEQSKTDDIASLYAMSPSLLQRDDLTIYGMNRVRSEWKLLNELKRVNLRIVFTREDEEDNRSLGAPTERFSRDVSARIELVPLPALVLSFEGTGSLRTRESSNPFDQNYRIESQEASQTLNYRLGPSTRLSLETGLEKKRDEISLAEQISYRVAPSVTAAIGSSFNLTSLVRFTYTDSKRDENKPLFFLEAGWREDWSILANYRVTKRVSFGINYTGRREKDFLGNVETIHDFKAESRAYF
jgi:hypothetical protein